MEAAVLGAVFFLALFGPSYFGGYQFTMLDPNGTTDASWRILLTIIGAGGVGAILNLVGQAVWELVFSYGPRSGLMVVLKGRKDFRSKIAEAKAEPYAGDFDVTGEAKQKTRWWIGHDTLIPVEFLFYRDAPTPVLEWCRRRHQRFGAAWSVVSAILLGIVLGFVYLRAPNVGKQLLFDGALVAVLAATVLWATEVRRQAQEMEIFWFANKLKHHGEHDQTHVVFDSPTLAATETLNAGPMVPAHGSGNGGTARPSPAVAGERAR